MSAAPRFHVIPGGHGEVVTVDPLEKIKELQAELGRHLQTVRAQAIELSKLRADKEAEALHHPLYDLATELFEYWQEVCKHPNAGWPGRNGERFWMVLPFLRSRRGARDVNVNFWRCKAAIAGLAYDHYVARARNGSMEHYTDWEHVFGSSKNYEKRLRTAPRPVLEKLKSIEAGNDAGAPEGAPAFRKQRKEREPQLELDPDAPGAEDPSKAPER